MGTNSFTESLQNHANLQDGDRSRSFLHALWLRKRGEPHTDLEALTDNLLDLLAELNTKWNTSDPEAVSGKVRLLERNVVGALTGIVACGHIFTKDHPSDREALTALFRIETAWRAVLDGDITDLRRHISEIEAMS